MRQLQGAIQYVANRMNVIGNDDITAIKDIVVTKGNVNKAIQAHQAHLEEQTTAHNDNKNTIVTGGDIRKVMNREIGD
jgi:hypothetical protein